MRNGLDTKTKIRFILSDGAWHTLTEMTRATKSTKVATRISDPRKDGAVIVNRRTVMKNSLVKSEYRWFLH